MRNFFSAFRYLGGKALSILATIFIGVFLTILIVNYPQGRDGSPAQSPFQIRLEGEIQAAVEESIGQALISVDASGNPDQEAVDDLVARLRADAGLDLPAFQRYLLWTVKALSFDWGELNSALIPYENAQGLRDKLASNIVLQFLPNTLLLVGTAYLLAFMMGMPLALYLARRYGSWLDRVMSLLSPISSVPSWVFAMLLVTIFAVQLRWLPVSGMFGTFRPTEPIPYLLDLVKHMILPVTALVLSLLFQLVYTWRTFLVIYSEEDYVDLARAKGLEPRLLEKQYILRPALPYIVTSFATSLIGFWQLTVVLEKIFNWPGLGMLYINTLPNYWGESVSYGDLMVVVQIVVTFSYLLGILVFLLDISYVIMDPRIHLVPKSNLDRPRARVKPKRLPAWRKDSVSSRVHPSASRWSKRVSPSRRMIGNLRAWLQEMRERTRLFAHQLLQYPSAIFGLVVIVFLLAGSLYAILFLPYEQIGVDFEQDWLSGRNFTPRTAAPAWTNLFSFPPRLSTLILDENREEARVSSRALENGWVEKTITFRFAYPYREPPSDVFLYIDTDYVDKYPFVSFAWTTPDGRTIDLKPRAVAGDGNYSLKEGIPIQRLLAENPRWRNWFVTDGPYPTPNYKLLFADPTSVDPVPLRGNYQLQVTGLLFEKDGDVQPHLVMLGQVYGLAGTDYWRRDLTVPLFWGMPFALLIGFMGTLLTTLVAMLLPAIGVWFGGWVDGLVQRLTEVNMVLPGLAIAVLVYALFFVNIWIILAIVVALNAMGAPIKTFRSALLQAKEAPYIEMARSYGASDFRIISRYLVPRILPVLIPHLVMQIPTFIFLEATLGFFNIHSYHPSWGKIIYEGLAEGALYGSPYWVLEPIFLLLLTGLAFAMLGSALERILNPRIIDTLPATRYANK
jgi:peptide/nickel transport system permease protein